MGVVSVWLNLWLSSDVVVVLGYFWNNGFLLFLSTRWFCTTNIVLLFNLLPLDVECTTFYAYLFVSMLSLLSLYFGVCVKESLTKFVYWPDYEDRCPCGPSCLVYIKTDGHYGLDTLFPAIQSMWTILEWTFYCLTVIYNIWHLGWTIMPLMDNCVLYKCWDINRYWTGQLCP